VRNRINRFLRVFALRRGALAEAARHGRTLTEVVDAMAWVHAFVPAVEAHAIHGRLTAIGKILAASEDEIRTLDQVRADAFCDLLIEGGVPAHPAEARGIRATVVVTVPALALLDDAVTIGGVHGGQTGAWLPDAACRRLDVAPF
jgi:hypothetical protein